MSEGSKQTISKIRKPAPKPSKRRLHMVRDEDELEESQGSVAHVGGRGASEVSTADQPTPISPTGVEPPVPCTRTKLVASPLRVEASSTLHWATCKVRFFSKAGDAAKARMTREPKPISIEDDEAGKVSSPKPKKKKKMVGKAIKCEPTEAEKAVDAKVAAELEQQKKKRRRLKKMVLPSTKVEDEQQL